MSIKKDFLNISIKFTHYEYIESDSSSLCEIDESEYLDNNFVKHEEDCVKSEASENSSMELEIIENLPQAPLPRMKKELNYQSLVLLDKFDRPKNGRSFKTVNTYPDQKQFTH